MAEVPFWYDDPKAWDRCVLKSGEGTTTVVLPGLCRVRVKRKLGAEKSKAAGTSGETVKWTGKKNADVVIVQKLFTRADLVEFGRTCPILESGKKSEQVWAITHPTAQLRAVASITIDEIDGPSDEGEIRIVTYSCFETPEPKKTGTGTATGPGDSSYCAKMRKSLAAAYASMFSAPTDSKLDEINIIKATLISTGCEKGPTPSSDATPPTGEV